MRLTKSVQDYNVKFDPFLTPMVGLAALNFFPQ